MTNSSNRHGNNEKPSGENKTGDFQPEKYLEQRNGLPYLPLKWRLAWLRADHPDAVVDTRLISTKKGAAIFQAAISLPNGGSATGWGMRRDPQSAAPVLNEAVSPSEISPSYLTEAENQALERALAILGYGIEYATDFDLPNEGEPIPLRDTAQDQAEEGEAGIEVPLNPVEGEPFEEHSVISRNAGTINFPASKETSPEIAGEEEEDVEQERAEDEFETKLSSLEMAPPTPFRSMYEEPARFSPVPTPLRPVRPTQSGTPLEDRTALEGDTTLTSSSSNLPTPISARHQSARRQPGGSEGPSPANSTEQAPLSGAAVEERLKGISDHRQILVIKQIFHEARRLHNRDEDTVDRRSQALYGAPVNRLTYEQASEYLERIKTSPTRPPRK